MTARVAARSGACRRRGSLSGEQREKTRRSSSRVFLDEAALTPPQSAFPPPKRGE